ncbi:4-(cytidine 5'-diphospho)-2-C-methyl-D-erythritol kinase [Aporhodopirellula aestuarii]|uniref:4-diphosphocytidyl-2-C-methyl-D-erythritol kinase n=1 Tax=Aporhodopirellula aestuarii TaxID=2950107 RepID=A0ABT0U7A5_9BACT|nr:4-(cytidine 5'-diphospho)-2-C-methyl-D-erythritol kinase [Aporhodopirellula aestuarii]MCM2372809.1 4-(cytidine 5'-diphospho)-2-C-methyl-D-erythritol kinase [Aporhodopirellula aestuarii]
MVAIDWRDELHLQPTTTPGIELAVDWLPDRDTVAEQLGVAPDDALLDVPTDERNLVYRALQLIGEATGFEGGWKAELGKRIPSGAGMGGASSDAAATLRLAKSALADCRPNLAGVLTDEKMAEIAACLGSDVPFFLGNTDDSSTSDDASRHADKRTGVLARALGRGEKLTYYDLPRDHLFLVVFPATALSTAAVYSRAKVSDSPKSGLDAINAFIRPSPNGNAGILYNALAEPASGLSPRVAEALEYLRESKANWKPESPFELECQMTGSGSACFAWLTSDGSLPETVSSAATIAATLRTTDVAKARELIASIREQLPGGALIQLVATCPAAPEIHIA